MATDREALGAFLRARRDAISPATAGIEPFPGARRVPGLRKEELALLAGLSPDYYSRVEQGRQAHVSREVLDALARALRLDEVERAHLHDLADPAAMRSRAGAGARAGHEVPQRADPGLLRVMDALGHLPVILLGRRGEVLASNPLVAAVLGADLPPGASFVRWLFLDPGARERVLNWEVFAQASVGALRRESGRHPGDRRLRGLVDEVTAADADVARWWSDHGVRDYASVAKRIRDPALGDLEFGIEIVIGPADPEQRLVVYTVEAGSATESMLPILASWGAGSPRVAEAGDVRPPRGSRSGQDHDHSTS